MATTPIPNPKRPRLPPAQKKALKRYNFCLREEDRLGGSAFSNRHSLELQQAKTRQAYEDCLRLGMTHDHGL
jgi:hypothetical protein